MRNLLVSVLLLMAGLPQFAHAACGGSQVSIPPVRGIHNDAEYGRVLLNYNTSNDTYCATMITAGPRENVPTHGQLYFDICAAGLNSSGNCKGAITRGSEQFVGVRSYQFGPIRVSGSDRCVKARGILSWQRADGTNLSAIGQTTWKCYR